jgi:hypothetical protein
MFPFSSPLAEHVTLTHNNFETDVLDNNAESTSGSVREGDEKSDVLIELF